MGRQRLHADARRVPAPRRRARRPLRPPPRVPHRGRVVRRRVAAVLDRAEHRGAHRAPRALQGVGAALLTPGSLAILEASFVPDDRAAAIGAWSGLGGIMTAIGPFLGGWLVQSASWRWIFLINLPFAAVVLWVGLRHVPETKNEHAPHGTRRRRARCSTILGLAGVIAGLTSGPEQGWTSPERPRPAGRRAGPARRVRRGRAAQPAPARAARDLQGRPSSAPRTW